MQQCFANHECQRIGPANFEAPRFVHHNVFQLVAGVKLPACRHATFSWLLLTIWPDIGLDTAVIRPTIALA
jgi:hypothetical protein